MDIPRDSGCAPVGLDASDLQSDLERGVFRERLEEDVEGAVAIHVDGTNQPQSSRRFHAQGAGGPQSLESSGAIPVPEKHVTRARISQHTGSVERTMSAQRCCVLSPGQGSGRCPLPRDMDGPCAPFRRRGEAANGGGRQWDV